MKKLSTILLLTFLIAKSNAQQWQSISRGPNHTMAIKKDGTLWAWGFNRIGQLGTGTEVRFEVTPIKIGIDKDWLEVSAGNGSTLALKSDGTMWSWGFDAMADDNGRNNNIKPTKVDNAKDWKKIYAESRYFIAMKTNGTLWAWGKNKYGQLGVGDTLNRLLPTQIMPNSTWVDFSLGGGSAAAIKSDGTLWAWGNNGAGQLITGNKFNVNTPQKIGNNKNWKKVFCGGAYMVALKNDGTIWGWGNNYNVHPSSVIIKGLIPTQIGIDNDWETIALKDHLFLGIKTNGTLWAGDNGNYGVFGDGTNVNIKTAIHQVGTLTDWSTIAVGAYTVFALKANGTLWAWGFNESREFGNNTNTNSNIPILIN